MAHEMNRTIDRAIYDTLDEIGLVVVRHLTLVAPGFCLSETDEIRRDEVEAVLQPRNDFPPMRRRRAPGVQQHNSVAPSGFRIMSGDSVDLAMRHRRSPWQRSI